MPGGLRRSLLDLKGAHNHFTRTTTEQNLEYSDATSAVQSKLNTVNLNRSFDAASTKRSSLRKSARRTSATLSSFHKNPG